MTSTPLWQLDCRTQSFVLGICVDDPDLESLLPWHAIALPCGVPAELGRRSYLHALCKRETPVARSLSDILDLRHVETVLAIRSASERDVRARFLETVRARRHTQYPALLWAIATDARPGVRVVGGHLLCECFLLGCRYLRNGASA
ncbi:MAG: hypothetical protein ACKVWV_08485 [Planctomycetota bacterium]